MSVSSNGNGKPLCDHVQQELVLKARFEALTREIAELDAENAELERSAAAFARFLDHEIDEEHWRLKRAEHVAEHSDDARIAGNAARRADNGKGRNHGRRVDLGPLLAAPARPVPWRVWDFVADGTVTVLSGEAGSGKSWLAQALCTGVALGLPVAGLGCELGKALYVDAEMGPQMFVDQRLRPAGITEPLFEYVDGMGLDVAREDGLGWLRGEIIETGANLVVLDSLRRLSPSTSENDSDDMAPLVGSVAKLARDTGAAIVLIHHKGDSEKFYRGSTTIKDQADAMFGLLREEDDDDSLVRRLRCRGKGKMRYAPEPADVYLTISPFDGGVAACEQPDQPFRIKAPTRESVKAEILAALPAKTKLAVAAKLNRRPDDPTFRAAWAELDDEGEIVKEEGAWKKGGGAETLGNHHHHLFSDDDYQERGERLFEEYGGES